MAFGRFEHRSTPQPEPLSGINVTPLVDVMLVLVVILILAAPVLAAALRVQLPHAQGATPLAAHAAQQALALEIDAQGGLWIDGQTVEKAALQQRLAALAAVEPQAELQLRADAVVPYGRIVAVMGWAHAAGLTRIGFVAEPAPMQSKR